MKLRIKWRQQKFVINFEEDDEPTLQRLKDAVKENCAFCSTEEFQLTLNGQDILADYEKSLRDLGIVPGDLIHVLSEVDPKPVHPVTPPTVVSTQAGPSRTLSKEMDGTAPSYMEIESDFAPSCSETTEYSDVDRAEINRYLDVPNLCHESTSYAVPQLLQYAYQSSSVKSHLEALVVVLHVLMLETGFHQILPQVDSGSARETCTEGVTKLHYTSSGMPHESRGCTLSAVAMGSTCVVHGTIDLPNSAKFQIKILLADYIREVHKEAHLTYKALKKLSRLFKDTVSFPLLQALHEGQGITDRTGFLALCHEVKLQILRHLDACSLTRLSQVCKELLSVARDRLLWQRLYLRDYGKRSDCSLNRNWLKLYREMYLLRQQMRREARHIIPMPQPARSPFQPLSPFYPSGIFPGIIGGDYDLHPLAPVFDPWQIPRPRRFHVQPRLEDELGVINQGLGGFSPLIRTTNRMHPFRGPRL